MYPTYKRPLLMLLFGVLITATSWAQTFFTVETTQIYDENSKPLLSELNNLQYDTDAGSVVFYTTETAGSPIADNTSVENGDTYYIEATGTPINRRLRIDIVTTDPSIVATPASPCENSSATLSLNDMFTSSEFSKYSNELDSIHSIGNTHYYMYTSDGDGSTWDDTRNELTNRFPGARIYVENSISERDEINDKLFSYNGGQYLYNGVTSLSVWLGLEQTLATNSAEEPDDNWYWIDGRILDPLETNWRVDLDPLINDAWDEPNDWNQTAFVNDPGDITSKQNAAVNNSLIIGGNLAINDENYAQFNNTSNLDPDDPNDTYNLAIAPEWGDYPSSRLAYTLIEFKSSTDIRWGYIDPTSNIDVPLSEYDNRETIETIPYEEGNITTYYVTANLNGNSNTPIRREITITPTLLPVLEINGPKFGCLENNITYTTDALTGSGETIRWISSNTDVITIDENTGIATPVSLGKANIFFEYNNGVCTSAFSNPINIEIEEPTANAEINGDQEGCVEDTIELSTTATNPSWFSRDTSIATIDENSGIVTLNGTGTARIYYSTETSSGCVATSNDFTITVDGCEEIEDLTIYKGFSPNGDGLNDTFSLEGYANAFPDFTMIIYNRWGREVVTLDARTPIWEGKLDGENVTTGAYYYVLDIKDGSTDIQTGTIYVTR